MPGVLATGVCPFLYAGFRCLKGPDRQSVSALPVGLYGGAQAAGGGDSAGSSAAFTASRAARACST